MTTAIPSVEFDSRFSSDPVGLKRLIAMDALVRPIYKGEQFQVELCP